VMDQIIVDGQVFVGRYNVSPCKLDDICVRQEINYLSTH
jgi:hypothetical protein